MTKGNFPDSADPKTVIGRVQFNSLVYLGWKCPDCGTVWSPYVESCKNCVHQNSEYRDSTGTYKDRTKLIRE
jgi:uncharacterized OB-fold protein